ncbi:MATE family efflux transporter [Vibrio rhizosphaerae]|uniref:Multidrug export protein MepA n=1 Tax=Vibrio rhizosphaerae TaxID=398736 RepID=A0ABU4IS51_9VIBR|nr:MATE family efflux transporter [Vibrio rhizosphaerae]MDW6091947.1 MATE family efflux transporter [Vibrio rhizosphaerae]
MQLSIYSQYFRYAIPTVAAMLVNGVYQLIDGIFIGQYLGVDGLAGINIAWTMIGFLVGIGLMVGVGTGAITSIYKGQKNISAARQTISTGLILLVLLSVLLSVGLWHFMVDILNWQTHDPHVFAMAMQYMQVVLFTSCFTLASTAFPFLMRNDDSPALATYLMIIGGCLNIVFDYLFIVVWEMGLQGAAIATAISQGVVTIAGLSYFFSPAASLRLTLADLRFFRWQDIRQIVLVGLSSFFMYLYWSVMVALHNSQFAIYGGTTALGAYTILGYVVTFYYLTVEGFASGMQPLVSFNYGAKQWHNIKQLLWLAMGLSVSFGVIVTLVMNLYPHDIIAIFNRDNAELSDYATYGIRLHFIALFLDGFIVVASAFYQSINRGKKAIGIALGNILIQPPFLFLLPLSWGLTGVWLAFPISNIVLSSVVLVILYKDIRRLFYSAA